MPNLYSSTLRVMTAGQGKSYEDSAKNLDKHDEMLLKALNVPGTGMAATKDLNIYAIASSDFQPGSLEGTGASVTVRHPGYKMDIIEDDGWRRQISKEIARKKVDLLLLPSQPTGPKKRAFARVVEIIAISTEK